MNHLLRLILNIAVACVWIYLFLAGPVGWFQLYNQPAYLLILMATCRYLQFRLAILNMQCTFMINVVILCMQVMDDAVELMNKSFIDRWYGGLCERWRFGLFCIQSRLHFS